MPKNSPVLSTVQDLEKRFIFIQNEVLRKNLAINLQYIIFLLKDY